MPGVLIIEHLIKKPTKATQKYDWMNLENTIVWTEWLYIYMRERERERERERDFILEQGLDICT